jgi:hypothetical protein
VFDPKKKPVEEYQNLVDILKKAWAHFHIVFEICGRK